MQQIATTNKHLVAFSQTGFCYFPANVNGAKLSFIFRNTFTNPTNDKEESVLTMPHRWPYLQELNFGKDGNGLLFDYSDLYYQFYKNDKSKKSKNTSQLVNEYSHLQSVLTKSVLSFGQQFDTALNPQYNLSEVLHSLVDNSKISYLKLRLNNNDIKDFLHTFSQHYLLTAVVKLSDEKIAVRNGDNLRMYVPKPREVLFIAGKQMSAFTKGNEMKQSSIPFPEWGIIPNRKSTNDEKVYETNLLLYTIKY